VDIVLGGIEGIVKRREISLELFAIGPGRSRSVVGIDVGGEDPVEQFPSRAVDCQPVDIHQLRDCHEVAVGVVHGCSHGPVIDISLFKTNV
jgi:hypothetical protein